MKAAEENNEAQAPENGTLVKAMATDCDEATERLRQARDPIEIVKAARARIAALKFPTPERERAAAGNMASHSKMIDELIRNGADLNTLRSKVFEMEEACRRLSIPEKAPSFQEELYRTHPVFQQASWTAEEIDGLKRFFRDGDRISAIRVSSVKLGDRKVTRREVREKLKGILTAAHIEGLEKREAAAIQHERDNDARRERGEGTHHRQW